MSKPGDDVLNTTDELLEDIKEAVKRKAARRGETLEGVLARAGDTDGDRIGQDQVLSRPRGRRQLPW